LREIGEAPRRWSTMQKDKNNPEQSPADIAREAFKRLAMRRIAPTPDAYREIYLEIAGDSGHVTAERVLADFAASLADASADVAKFAAEFERAARTANWKEYSETLGELVDKHLKRVHVEMHGGADEPAPAPSKPKGGIPLIDPVEPVEPPASRPVSLPLVDDIAPARSKSAGIPLVDDVAPLDDDMRRIKPRQGAPAPSEPAESQQMRMLRDLLVRTLTLAVGSLLQNAPELLEEAESLATSIKTLRGEAALNDASGRLKQLCFRIELKSADMAEEHELLLRLFKLLLENVSELLEDDSWLSGQIAGVQNLLSGPINHNALMDATRSLKEVIYKQGLLKHSLTEAKVTVKNMMMTFIDRLGAVAVSTADYHEKIDKYSQKITKAQDITELNVILDDVMRDTRVAQTEALRSRDDMLAARQEVQDAESRIHELETKLQQMSELVREDQLTGSLNRRGLDDVFEREVARSERRSSPLCIAMLDLDDFKRLNDTYGHSAGDEALIHLVRVIKDTLRTMDVIARFGGEEFLIVLPDTPLEDAILTVTRLQRELTKRIFMHNNERLLMTFSAGVALRADGEDQAQLIKRVDDALYKAKREGKNRVVAAK
jgi:diguanylate cyclase